MAVASYSIDPSKSPTHPDRMLYSIPQNVVKLHVPLFVANDHLVDIGYKQAGVIGLVCHPRTAGCVLCRQDAGINGCNRKPPGRQG